MKKKLARLKLKWREHLENDPSGFSFFCYCLKYCVIKVFRSLKDFYYIRNYTVDRAKVAVAVRMTGGLGDTIIHRRFLDKIAELCPNSDFFVFCAVAKQGRWVFGNAPYVKAVSPLEMFPGFQRRYADIVLHLNTFAFFDEQHCNFGKIQSLDPFLLEMFSSAREKRKEWDQFIDSHPSLDGAFARQAVVQGFNRYNFIPHLLGIPVPEFALDLSVDMEMADKLEKEFGSYITINTGFDSYFIIAGRTATKCYPQEYWERLAGLLKTKYPELKIVQIGNKTGKHISSVDSDLAGKTTLSECTGILKKSRLHIDIEGGLVHICASIGTPCVTLFGPTSVEYFGYPQNIKLRDDSCPDCWWSTQNWMECCPRKYPRPECMYKLTPEKVIDSVSSIFDGGTR